MADTPDVSARRAARKHAIGLRAALESTLIYLCAKYKRVVLWLDVRHIDLAVNT